MDDDDDDEDEREEEKWEKTGGDWAVQVDESRGERAPVKIML